MPSAQNLFHTSILPPPVRFCQANFGIFAIFFKLIKKTPEKSRVLF